MATLVDLDDPFGGAVSDIREESAGWAENAGVARWGVAADGITPISFRGRIDIGGLETYTTEDRDEAVEWARSGRVESAGRAVASSDGWSRQHTRRIASSPVTDLN